ncbi:hypothetical protein PKCEKB_PKCEKB_00035, partial [Dysosmobacter welbionis]
PVSLPGRFRSSSDAGPMTASRRRMIRSSHLNPYPSAGCWSHRLMQASRRSSVQGRGYPLLLTHPPFMSHHRVEISSNFPASISARQRRRISCASLSSSMARILPPLVMVDVSPGPPASLRRQS